MDLKTTDPQNEVFDVVNANDVVIGQATRNEVHKNPSLIHRVIHVWVVNNKNEILIQKRSLTKDKLAGFWDISCGGHVQSGFTPNQTVERELKEELGISGEPRFIKKYLVELSDQTEMTNLYVVSHNGPFKFSMDETSEVKFFSEQQVQSLIESKQNVSPFVVSEIPIVFDFLKYD